MSSSVRRFGMVLWNYVNWKNSGGVAAVKNQVQTDICWAFTGNATVEFLHFRAIGKLITLSEQELCDCDRKYNSGCRRGTIEGAYSHMIENGGVGSDADYPYTEVGGLCRKEREVKQEVNESASKSKAPDVILEQSKDENKSKVDSGSLSKVKINIGNKEKSKDVEKLKEGKVEKEKNGKTEVKGKEVRDKKVDDEPGLFLQTKGSKDSRLRSLSLSLDSLLGYDDNDIEESAFEKRQLEEISEKEKPAKSDSKVESKSVKTETQEEEQTEGDKTTAEGETVVTEKVDYMKSESDEMDEDAENLKNEQEADAKETVNPSTKLENAAQQEQEKEKMETKKKDNIDKGLLQASLSGSLTEIELATSGLKTCS